MDLKEFRELDSTKKTEIMNTNQAIILAIIKQTPFLFKDYLILDHEDPEVDLGLKRFWLHIKENELNIHERYKVTPDEQHFEGWQTFYQQHVLIGKLKNVWTGDIMFDWSYSAFFKRIFSKYKNAEEYYIAQVWQEINFREEERIREREKMRNRYPRLITLNPYNY